MVFQALFLVALLAAERLPQHLVVIVEQGRRQPRLRRVERGKVGTQCAPERERGRKESLLQQHADHVGDVLASVHAPALGDDRGELFEPALFVVDGCERHRRDAAALEPLRGDLGLESPHGDILEGPLVEVGAAAEPVIVDHL